MDFSLPSLGATTSVPGAAGSPVVGPAGGFVDDEGVINLTVRPPSSSTKFGDTMKQLFNVSPDELLQSHKPVDASVTNVPASSGTEVMDGPFPVNGSFEEILDWLKANGVLLLVWAVVLLLALYGLSAATRR